VRVEESLTFVNSSHVKDSILAAVPAAQSIKFCTLDASTVNDIDMTGVRALADLHKALSARGVGFYLGRVKGHVRDRLRAFPAVFEKLGGELMYLGVGSLVQRLSAKLGRCRERPKPPEMGMSFSPPRKPCKG
jgi:hypothetical protein